MIKFKIGLSFEVMGTDEDQRLFNEMSEEDKNKANVDMIQQLIGDVKKEYDGQNIKVTFDIEQVDASPDKSKG